MLFLFFFLSKWNCVVESLLVLVSFESEGWEVGEATVVSTGKEPLEETPQEAEGEEFTQHPHLFPDSAKIESKGSREVNTNKHKMK